VYRTLGVTLNSKLACSTNSCLDPLLEVLLEVDPVCGYGKTKVGIRLCSRYLLPVNEKGGKVRLRSNDRTLGLVEEDGIFYRSCQLGIT
jgi:hypothetical protein